MGKRLEYLLKKHGPAMQAVMYIVGNAEPVWKEKKLLN
jgi:hypothetical protein